jgi:hypothetical protein
MSDMTKQKPAAKTTEATSSQNQAERSLSAEVEGEIDSEVRLLAAVAYGEASTDDDSEEVLGIAYAVTNRARAWGEKKYPIY